MTKENGLVVFRSELGEGHFSQRNNQLVWPSEKSKPKAQYRTSWKNMCNVTAYVNALAKAGYTFPAGEYNQPEDNLGLFILTNPEVMSKWKKQCPAQYDLFMKSLDGKLTEKQLNDMYFPTELHDYLSFGANKWIGTSASSFSTNHDFRMLLWNSMVEDNLPLVLSTNFGGFGHIVCCTGVAYDENEFNNLKYVDKGTLTPKYIIVDDPWGKYNPDTNKYDAPNGGNDIFIPWSRVVASVKPANSDKIKWAHTFKHGIATV